jgi:hypothetical protein
MNGQIARRIELGSGTGIGLDESLDESDGGVVVATCQMKGQIGGLVCVGDPKASVGGMDLKVANGPIVQLLLYQRREDVGGRRGGEGWDDPGMVGVLAVFGWLVGRSDGSSSMICLEFCHFVQFWRVAVVG